MAAYIEVEEGISMDLSNETEKPEDSDDYVKVTIKMQFLDRIAKSDAHFKHQQRGEPNLAYEEKLQIATEILDNKPSVFLSRFGKHLQPSDIPYFEHLPADYTINFYLQEIKKRHDDSKSQKIIRNRRYEAMKKLIESGEYFSDKEMKSRDPMLYEQMIGRYLSEDEIQKQVEESGDGSIASVLMQHIEALHNNEVYAKQVEQEESQMEEGDSDEDLSDEEKLKDSDEEEEELEDEVPAIPEDEKLMLRNEFEAMMQQRFLSGQDQDFDYGTVDDNVEYDSLDIRGRDEEEKYFDDDDDYFSDTGDELDDEKCNHFAKMCTIPSDIECDKTVREKNDTEMVSDPT